MPLTKVTSGVIAANAVVDSFGTQSITGDKIGLTAINANNIVNATITGAKLAANTITGDVIGQNAISSNNIVASPTLTTPIISGNLNLDSTGTTGVRVPAANTIAIHTAGTEDIRITSNGWVGVGTTTPANTFSVKGTGIVAERDVDTDRLITTYNDINIYANATGGTNHNTFTIRHSNNSVTNNRMRITATGLFQFDSGYGDIATAYGVRAWVNFNGTSTVAIRSSGNVSSITDNGAGDYTVNFSNAMPDGNYAVAGTAMFSSSINDHFITLGDTNGAGGTLPSNTAVRFRTMYNNSPNTPQDCTYVTLMVIR